MHDTPYDTSTMASLKKLRLSIFRFLDAQEVL
jgi:hypothetical protein